MLRPVKPDSSAAVNARPSTPAHKLARIIWRCWQDRRPYDDARYEAALRQAGSPVVALFDRVDLGKSSWKTPAKKS